MKSIKRALCFFLAIILASTSFGSVAYANPEDELSQSVQSEGNSVGIKGSEDDSPSAQTGDEGNSSGLDGTNSEPGSPDTPTEGLGTSEESLATHTDNYDSGRESRDENAEELEAPPHAANAADCIEYVFLDEKVLALDEEGYLAFGLLDEKAVITSAELVLRKDSSGGSDASHEPSVFESTAEFENSALFSIVFSEPSDTASYVVESICYSVQGSDAVVQATFNPSSPNNTHEYRIEVVTKEVQKALLKEEVKEETTTFVLNEGGSLAALGTVVEALDVAEEETDSSVEYLEDIEFLTVTGIDAPIVPAAATSARMDYLVVAIDPGHGGNDPGAVGNNLREADTNWITAQSMRKELHTYTGVYAFFTRTENENPSLQQRVDRAVNGGADVFISLHNNASGSGAGTGAEVWVPNNSSYRNRTHVVGKQLGTKILEQLSGLGLANRGVKVLDNVGATYPDGSVSDYYGVIRASRMAGIPGIIVEHAFIDNPNDAKKLSDPKFLEKLGRADATAVAKHFKLAKASTAKGIATVQYKAHVSRIGWLPSVYDLKTAGVLSTAHRIEAFSVELLNAPAQVNGALQYQAHVVGSGWQGWKNAGQTAGTTGQSKAIQAIQMRLSGNLANSYDVYYRTKVSGIGWLGWARNGASAGTAGAGRTIEGFQVALVNKGAAAPGSREMPYLDGNQSVLSYQAHVARIGWQSNIQANTSRSAGTIGQAARVEALKLSFIYQDYTGGIQTSALLAGIGWQGWRNAGSVSGTTGQSRQMEAVRIRLTGDMARNYDIYYRVHAQSFGWLDWAKNGAPAGSSGYGYRLEAVQIQLVRKVDGSPPKNTTSTYKQTSSAFHLPAISGTVLNYEAHVAQIGWQGNVFAGSYAGTTGQSRAVEALKISLSSSQHSGTIEYNSHLARIGWQGWKTSGQVAGTTGQRRQMEAIQIRLTGDLAKQFDVYYRVHSQRLGWLGWARNGASAGSAGYGYRLECIQIRLVPKGSAAPGSTSNSYRDRNAPASTSLIMGTSQTTVAQMVNYYKNSGSTYPSQVYKQYGAPTINDWCRILLEEAKKEGVRAEVVMVQAMKETGWLRFGGQVSVGQCNFGGLGATNNGSAGADFSSHGNNAVRIGLRAQIQHLKGYATTVPASSFASPIVSPRLHLLEEMGYRGIAPRLEGLNGRWAVPGTTYGQDLQAMINAMLKLPK
ncbi:MAG: N-acetylmuramoyl-L-alanine amidase [Coriobacteriia bacterium]|nr:N-acetylmuramoyl-L-alanine amidase [Coriobacteriia bacterium]